MVSCGMSGLPLVHSISRIHSPRILNRETMGTVVRSQQDLRLPTVNRRQIDVIRRLSGPDAAKAVFTLHRSRTVRLRVQHAEAAASRPVAAVVDAHRADPAEMWAAVDASLQEY